MQFDCVFYYVTNLDRAIAFYRDTFGLELHSRDAVARFDLDGVLIELVPATEPLLAGTTNARLTLKVANLGDTIRDLRAKGVTVVDPYDVAGGRLAALHDPDGNEIVLWQYTHRS